MGLEDETKIWKNQKPKYFPFLKKGELKTGALSQMFALDFRLVVPAGVNEEKISQKCILQASKRT